MLFWVIGTIFVIMAGRQYFFNKLRRSWKNFDLSTSESIEGKVVIVTGGNTGIGKATCETIANLGGTVILACRNLNKAKLAIKDIRTRTSNGNLVAMELDLSSFDSIRNFVKTFQKNYLKCHILINNAGVLMPSELKMKSADGYEIHFATNHLGHFLLTNLLLDTIKSSAPSRIITVTSHLHVKGEINLDDLNSDRKDYEDDILKVHFPYYANSKLANALFNKELGRRLEGTGVNSYALCPGNVCTDISRNLKVPMLLKLSGPLLKFVFKTPEEGAQTTLFCALSQSDEIKVSSGEMYRNCAFWKEEDRIALDPELAKKLWEQSSKIVGIDSNTNSKSFEHLKN